MKTTILAATILASLFGGVQMVAAHADTTPMIVRGVIRDATTHACGSAGAVNCLDSTRVTGPGHGQSSYRVQVGQQVCTIYTNRVYNRAHGHCE